MKDATKQRITFYSAFGVIFFVSALSYFLAANHEFVQTLVAIPMVASLVGGLFQAFRDLAAHERSVLLMDAQHHFSIGASSHMANIAFDKHVLFAEAYMKGAQQALRTLFRLGGASEDVLKDASHLHAIREEHIVWLTVSVEKALDQFEGALRDLGATAGFVKSTQNSAAYQEQRSKAIDHMYRTFAKVMAFQEWEGEKLTDDLAIAAVTRHLRGLLGTEELTDMRQSIISKGVASARSKGIR